MEFQGMLMPNDLLGNTEFMRTWLLKSENILPKWDITFSVLKLLSFLKSKTYLQKTSQLQCTIIAFIKKMWCCLKTTDKIKNQGTKHNKKTISRMLFPLTAVTKCGQTDQIKSLGQFNWILNFTEWNRRQR